MIENSTQGLTLLDADLDVEVIGTDAAALARWAPDPQGHARRVAAELAAVADGPGREWIEVRIDGVPVGRLDPRAAQRHARHLDTVLDRGGRPAAHALVGPGPRLELRLPHPAAPVRAPLPPAVPAPARPTTAVRWDSPAPRRTPPRLPLLIGAGVLALLVAVGVVVGTRGGEESVASAPRLPTTTTSPTATTPAAPTTVEPEPDTATDAGEDTDDDRPAPTRSRTPRPARTTPPEVSADTRPAATTPPQVTGPAEPTGTAAPGAPAPTSRNPRANLDCDPLVGRPDPRCPEDAASPTAR